MPMASKEDRHEKNVPGKYYVDTTCAMCQSCMEFAPDFLGETEEGDQVVVTKQPKTDEEIEQMEEALAACPTESIGDDGE